MRPGRIFQRMLTAGHDSHGKTPVARVVQRWPHYLATRPCSHNGQPATAPTPASEPMPAALMALAPQPLHQNIAELRDVTVRTPGQPNPVKTASVIQRETFICHLSLHLLPPGRNRRAYSRKKFFHAARYRPRLSFVV